MTHIRPVPAVVWPGALERRRSVFDRILAAPAAERGAPDRLMIDTTHLKANRTAASLLKKGLLHAASDARKAA